MTALAFDPYLVLSDQDCIARIRRLRPQFGDSLCILGHYYQRDEVYQFADQTGDSLKLAYLAKASDAKVLLFCGVHFMAEVADILTRDDQVVILPDKAAGCSMADMANLPNVQGCWDALSAILDADSSITPITYVNSSANLKAFCADHGGTVCTSSNAKAVLEWAFTQREKVLFFPDQHLGRNTAYQMGIPLSDMVLWNFRQPQGGVTPDEVRRAKVLLWDGWCSVHQKFQPSHIDAYLQQYPDTIVVAHPEAPFEVCQKADVVGSTSKIIETIAKASPHTRFLVATELNLVNRLHKQYQAEGKIVQFMSPTIAMCSTMFRTDPQHVLWVLDNLAEGQIVNQIKVPKDIAERAKLAIERMFIVTQ
jgi:quinolinate synthase